MTAVRDAVHELHRASEAREAYRWAGASMQELPTRSPVARLCLAADAEAADPDLLALIVSRLRTATTSYAAGLRADGSPPEEMLVRVKELTRNALADDGWWDRGAARSLTAAMVVWSIDAYFGR